MEYIDGVPDDLLVSWTHFKLMLVPKHNTYMGLLALQLVFSSHLPSRDDDCSPILRCHLRKLSLETEEDSLLCFTPFPTRVFIIVD